MLKPVICDKLSVTVDVPDSQIGEVGAVLANMVDAGYLRKGPGSMQYQKSYRYLLGDFNDKSILVQWHPYGFGKKYFRFEFNPSNGHLPEIQEVIGSILPGGYSQFVQEGKCTRIDLAVDVPLPINQLLFWKSGIQKTSSYGKGASLETYYLGNTSGKNLVCIYDKVQEVKAKNSKTTLKQSVPVGPLTRIEVRYCEGWPLESLANLTNPFAKISVYSVPTCMYEQDELIRLFFLAARVEGLKLAIAQLNKATQKEMHAKLENWLAGWWQPEEIWGEWYVVAQEILTPKKPPYLLAQKLGFSA